MKHAGLQQEGQESRMLCLPDFQALFPGCWWALSNKLRHKGLPLQVHGIFLYWQGSFKHRVAIRFQLQPR